MDTITHLVFGALAARAVTPGPTSKINPLEAARLLERMTVTAIAAGFPDIDYLAFWFNPLVFLAQWHRSLTHSLILLPLWALALGSILRLYPGLRDQWRMMILMCGLGLGTHLFLDLLEIYGTKLLYPLSDARFSLGTTFVVDPIVSAIVAMALATSLYWPTRLISLLGLFTLLVYLGAQGLLKAQALEVANKNQSASSSVHREIFALPRPFSPFHWQLIVKQGETYEIAALDLLSQGKEPPADQKTNAWAELLFAYRSRDDLQWIHYSLFGSTPERVSLVREVWQHEAFAEFRNFAVFPVLYRIDQSQTETCVWFTDLRYVIPGMIPMFRFGMCRLTQGGQWQLYRLRYFTQNERQLIQ